MASCYCPSFLISQAADDSSSPPVKRNYLLAEIKMNRPFEIVLACLIAVNAAPATYAQETTKPVIQWEVIDQPVEVVWQAIQAMRTNDPEHRKLLSYSHNEAIIEEKFGSIPLIGDTICTYKESELPPNQIKYALLKSDHFRTFEGSWTLTPIGDDKTRVELTSTLDPGVRVPFWREISRNTTSNSVRHRLEALARQAQKLAALQTTIAKR
jgi:hypothetical protein